MRLYKLTYTILCLAPMFAGCAVDDGAPDKPNATVHMTVDVTRGDGTTRSILTENEGNLSCDWQTTDVLVVTDAQGNELGTLNVKEIGTDASKATFAGDIERVADGSNVTFNYIYLGNKGKTGVTDANATYTVDYTAQSGTFASLSDRDVMTASATGSVKDGVAIVPGVKLVRKVSFAKFALTLKGDGAISKGATVSISGTGLKTSLALDKKNAEATVSADDGTITLANVNPSELYVTLLPSADIKELNFTVTSGESTYSGKYTVTKGIAAGKYYRKENGDGTYGSIAIEVVPAQDPELVGKEFEITGTDGVRRIVRFTRANLHFNTKTSSYYLPEKQTDFTTKSGRRYLTGSGTNPEVIDLFRWGATGIEDDVWNPRPADFWKEQQWNTNSRGVIDGQFPSANTSVNATLNTNSTLCPGESSQFTSYDWGKAYGKQHNGTYFTLTFDQLKGVLNGYFTALGTVDNVWGAILIFETSLDKVKQMIEEVGGKTNTLYKLELTTTSSGQIKTYSHSDKTQYDWNRISLTYDQLNKLNAVFFPAAGMNNPDINSDYDKTGYYWTSTVQTTPNAGAWYFNGTSTQSSRAYQMYGRGKGQGLSVRLVKEIKIITKK